MKSVKEAAHIDAPLGTADAVETAGRTPTDDQPSEAAARAALERVLASDDFTASARNRSFLSYVVEEALAGRGNEIKAYTVATSVFGRRSDFDPQLDTIVRIEAGRLRRALERYYLTAGREDPVRLTIPTGGYVPAFETPGAGTPRRANGGQASAATVLMHDFERLGGDESSGLLARMLTTALVARLTGERLVEVVFPAVLGRGSDLRGQGAATAPNARFLLAGGAAIIDGIATVDAMLAEAATGRIVWAVCLEHPIRDGDFAKARRDLADALAASFATRAEDLRRDPRAGADAAHGESQ